MNTTIAVALNMGTGAWIATLISGISFIIMFGIASTKGDYQGLIKTTLENDAAQRKKKRNLP
tara:strand:+ start:247 stop:432 length:186 start_codon:yes stop_codon:yes gene_type:complete